jgi:hypothetical protein
VCFDFLYKFFSKIFLKITTTTRDIFSTDFRKKKKKTQISDFIKIRPVGAELFHADGRTDGQADTTKIVVGFLQVCERAKSYLLVRQAY